MKQLMLFLLISGNLFSQPNKTGLDSVVLNNENVNWSKGVPTVRGLQNIKRDVVWGSFYSLGSTDKIHPGQFNIGIGDGTFENALEQQAKYNIHIGQRAGWKTTNAKNNVWIGWEAGRENTTGSDNVGISEDALRDNIRGYNNVAIGRGAMISNTIGRLNTAVGYNALQANLDGEGNTAYGAYSLAWLRKGSNNIGIGIYGGENNSSDGAIVNNSIWIGNQSGLSGRFSNSICIGTNTEVDRDNKINIGNTIYGDIASGDVSAKSFTISGRQITFDDNYMYVKTSTGIVKKVPLQDLSTQATAQEPQMYMLYDLLGNPVNGKYLIARPVPKNK